MAHFHLSKLCKNKLSRFSKCSRRVLSIGASLPSRRRRKTKKAQLNPDGCSLSFFTFFSSFPELPLSPARLPSHERPFFLLPSRDQDGTPENSSCGVLLAPCCRGEQKGVSRAERCVRRNKSWPICSLSLSFSSPPRLVFACCSFSSASVHSYRSPSTLQQRIRRNSLRCAFGDGLKTHGDRRRIPQNSKLSLNRRRPVPPSWAPASPPRPLVALVARTWRR